MVKLIEPSNRKGFIVITIKTDYPKFDLELMKEGLLMAIQNLNYVDPPAEEVQFTCTQLSNMLKALVIDKPEFL